MSDLKIAIVVMAHNPYQYFAEFIVQNKNLADQIYVIDHRSNKKIQQLNIEGVSFIESNQVAQFQSEVTNTVIRDFRLYDKYDWIFVLDIDEFLPFNSKNHLCQFLQGYAKEKALAFNWRNGVGVYPTVGAEIKPEDSLIDVSPLLVSDYISPHIKVAVNCNRLRYPFFFKTGAHMVVKPSKLLSKLARKNIYKNIRPASKHHFIYHIVAFDRNSFYKKIKNYVDQMEMRKHVRGQGGWMVKEYLVDFDDRAWLDIIQNFRVSNKQQIIENVNESFFSCNDLFRHLSTEKIYKIKAKLLSLDEKKLSDGSQAEKIYMRDKSLDTDLTKNLQRFKVKTDNNQHMIEII